MEVTNQGNILFAILFSQVCPLAEHIDLKDHYLAFIELENFGIATDLPDERYYSKRGIRNIQISICPQAVCASVERHNPVDTVATVRVPAEVQPYFL